LSRVLIIFLDGVGIGEKDAEKNPFFSRNFKFIKDIFGETPHLNNSYIDRDNKYLFPVDAAMGITGIPQSGTGQTSILCGVNASEILNRHFGPFPHSILLPVLKEHNLFHSLMEIGKNVCFANAYPQRFFDYLESGHKRMGSFAHAALLSGMRLNDVSDVSLGKALSAEITNKVWNEKLGYNLEIISPAQAAKRLLNISSTYDFTIYEYFLTDHLGHGRNKEYFNEVTESIDEFLFHILTNLPGETTLLICSDHGNFEDISIKQHTLNPALTISAGKNSRLLATSIKKLYHIKPAIMELFRE
jgi:hypothetical protein